MPARLFPSAHAAYAWSYEILDGWRNGKAFDPDPEQFRGGTGVMGIVLAALDVKIIADRYDINNGCPSWFTLAFIDQPFRVEFYGRDKYRLEKAECAFCRELQDKGLINDPECKRICKGVKHGQTRRS